MNKMTARASLQPARPDSVTLPRSPTDGRKPARRIGLFGLFGIGNYGNDGSLEAMLRFLRSQAPTTEIVCICGDPDKIARRYSVESIAMNFRPKHRLLRWLNTLCLNIPGEIVSLTQALRHLREIDVLLIPGTGILDDYLTGPFGMPYWLFRWTVLARLFGTKVGFVSIGAGPIKHPLSRWLMKMAAKQADYVSYRDEISYNFMQSIGCDVSQHTIFPDIAFALPAPATFRPPRASGSVLTVGIGVMTYNGWRGDKANNSAIYEDYLAKMARFINWLITKGYRVRLLMGDTSDQATIEQLLEALYGAQPETSTAPIIAELAYSLHDVMRQMVDTDIVVATRFHNIVCSLKLGRPTLSIGYATKNDALLQSMGLIGFCQAIETLDFDLLTQQFEKLVANRKAYGDGLTVQNKRFREELQNQEMVLLNRYL
ncbi:hypothetical protein HYPDE_29568 [Hyphomicrobium denitrificans 1NES1]|uniref:Polysaccharide pyruvyl transferase domain-containing protein n=1 Tax=Hyphomicrobium denitrificans 1NES1 TaxID=670307 RepID=N0B3N6_9HYPH|nr:polysaccharide pyruvyl transferase family protein [Hyphomicrobium denitrificans]AGK57588.1 hypothetical protein HYPDE_29568 [Hyphomicrobium denitrificans 1NES1]